MFRSARLKLTLFYLAILVAMSLTLTLSLRLLAQHEYNRSNDAQYGRFNRYLISYPWNADEFSVRPEVMFGRIQSSEEQVVNQRLNHDLLMINLFALVVGGALSYWFAGRTLKPIEEAHELQARFASDASHELRTPLASMRVENEVFLRQPSFTEGEAREQIESNLEEVQRLENLASNLLALTHYDNVALEMKPVAIESAAKEAVEHARATGDIKKVHWNMAVHPAVVRAHYESLVQLIGILLDNAIKYGPEKGEVTIEGVRNSTGYVLRIIDQGNGIAEEDLPYIFDRLYRGDKSRTAKVGGYGLGLALARQIARANHAVLSAENRDGGACFELQLELAKDEKH